MKGLYFLYFALTKDSSRLPISRRRALYSNSSSLLHMRPAKRYECAVPEYTWLFQHATSKSLHGIGRRMEKLIEQRFVYSKPLQYLLGNVRFLNCDIICKRPILIPRWETEEWTHKAIQSIKKRLNDNEHKRIKVLDLCAGSGCITIAVKKAFNENVSVTGVDSSLKAIQLARQNAHINCASVAFKKFDILLGKNDAIFKSMESFDVILANPPYIPSYSFAALPNSVKRHEDIRALLVPMNDELLFHKRILEIGDLTMVKEIWVEVNGMRQYKLMEAHLRDHGLDMKWNLKMHKDTSGKARVLQFIRCSSLT